MNSTIIKVVAGGGKTTKSEEILRANPNGLYIAFNNDVVDEMRIKGFICKTIDSLFTSYIMPKFTSIIPLIGSGSRITYLDNNKLPGYLRGIGNLHINEFGDILYNNSKTEFNLSMKNSDLHQLKNIKNLIAVKYVFDRKELRLTHQIRGELISYIIKKYPNELIDIIDQRFSYVIFDETQDVKRHLEEFAKLIYHSNIKSYYLGDTNQNINGGGAWFEEIQPTKVYNQSHRCPDNNCKWIRSNLNIDIIGNGEYSSFLLISLDEVSQYDDGKRILLYDSSRGKIKKILENWSGEKYTIKSSKGKTLKEDIVIVGNSLNKKAYYTAITRTTKGVYSTINKIT